MKKNLDLVIEKLDEIMGKQQPEKLDEWWSGWEWNMKEYIIVKALEEMDARIEKLDKRLDKIFKGAKK